MPQPPHFSPLKKIQESRREGIATGFMVSFSDMSDSMRTLNVDDDTIGGLINRLDSLDEFEQHGFEVIVFKKRLADLIRIKTTLEDFAREQEQIEAVVAQTRKQYYESASEVYDIEQKAKELEDSLLVLQKKRNEVLDTERNLTVRVPAALKDPIDQ